MASFAESVLRKQLVERRERLEAVRAAGRNAESLDRLVKEVDSALERMAKGTFGLCDVCHEAVDTDRLLADPLLTICIDHLSSEQKRVLQEDLEMAARIQSSLLPPRNLRVGGWETHYHYQALGAVSGDYCDLIPTADGHRDLYFLLGDVSGKGVAASLMMSQLHAIFRSLIGFGMPLEQMVSQANRTICGSATLGQFATLVCGRAEISGRIELCNAGHLPVLLARSGGVTQIESTGFPLGMFPEGRYAVSTQQLQPDESLMLFSDGLTEVRNGEDEEYGIERLSKLASLSGKLSAEALVASSLLEVQNFRGGTRQGDDLTLLVLKRSA